MRSYIMIPVALAVVLAGCGSSEQLPDALGVEVAPADGTGNADWACEQGEDSLWTCRARDEQGTGDGAAP